MALHSPASGTRVFGATLAGAFGEEVAVAATSLNLVPDGVDDRHAAAFGVAHSTAYHVLRSFAALQPGEELIVLGAGGGVGLAAVQLGDGDGCERHRGRVVARKARRRPAVRSEQSRRPSRRLVARRVRAVLPGGGDVVIDPVGGDLSEPALRSLRWGGRFVTVGYAAGVIPKIPLNLVLLKGAHVLGFQMIDFMTHRPDELGRNQRELLELLAAGRATPHVGATFALADVAAALQYVADGRAIGKVVLDIADR